MHLFNPDFSLLSLLTAQSYQTRLKKTDGTLLTMSNGAHTMLNVEPGIVRINLSNTDTANLAVGESQPIEVTVTCVAYGQETKKIVYIESAITVSKNMSDN